MIENLTPDNEHSLQTLIRAITLSQGQFSLILLRCNYADLRRRITQRLHQLSPINIREITLPASVKTLYTSIAEHLGNEQPPALMVFGLENVKDIDTMLTAANRVREEFRINFPFPILLWVNDQILQKFIRLATDLENWSTIIEFENSNHELIAFLQQQTEAIFAGDVILNPQTCWELERAIQDLHSRGEVLTPSLQANLEFVRGLHNYLDDKIDAAVEHYQQSFSFWRQSENLERQGILLAHIALAYDRYAVINQTENQRYWQSAKEYLQQALDILEQRQYLNLVAKYINKLGEILQNLKAWSELENLAQKSLALQQYGTPLQVAQAYGFLAEVAVEYLWWEEANQLIDKALQLLFNISDIQPHTYSWYRLILAQTQQGLGNVTAAIHSLETARESSNHQYNPQLYISILEKLRSLYFEQGEYLKAFNFKLEQLQIEQQYGFRAFVGASYLNPQRQVINPGRLQVDNTGTISQEIAASGREIDVNRLRERISRNDYKLTIIHGQSGVGKSSILQAGLIPALQQHSIGERDALPILIRVYTDWVTVLGRRLSEEFEAVRGNKLTINLDSVTVLQQQLQNNAERNLLTVLIFDQFEEFFFVYPDKAQRRVFYKFLQVCLDLPFVKIIVSLQEEYLHRLLELEHLFKLDAINNNVLDKKNRYFLDNFSHEQVKDMIEKITKKTHLQLEPKLIDKLVCDLAEELGEVRPIELQIVGKQLQSHKITSLSEYQQLSTNPKAKLVEQFIDELLYDCGHGNEKTALLILYLLTDAKNRIRPLRTRKELAVGLGGIEASQLDLILTILVKSGLVSLLPDSSGNRYQLVHDYLVNIIRDKQIKSDKETNRESVAKLQASEAAKQSKIDELDREKKLLLEHVNILKNQKPSKIKELPFLSTLLILVLLFLIVVSIVALNQKQVAIGLVAFGSSVLFYNTYKIKQQQKKFNYQIIQEQEKTIELLKSLLREGAEVGREANLSFNTQPQSGQLLNNRYKVTQVLGSGGFGYTYLADDTKRPGSPKCVVKHLQPAQKDPRFLEVARRLFNAEAEILEVLGHHKQIPQLLAYFEENQQFYLVQEFIKGHSLQEELTPGKRLEESEVITILMDVSEVLAFVHAHNVIHRDIKPSNFIRRGTDNKIVLIDFGAVKQIQPHQEEENLTVAVGTLGYAAPEQLMGQPRLNSDIHALGMIAIQALTGINVKELERDPQTTVFIWRNMAQTTEKLAEIIDRMTSFDYLRRYQSAKEVLQDLSKFK